MADSEIVQFYQGQITSCYYSVPKKVCSISKPASGSVAPSLYLYSYMIAQFLSVKQTECSYVKVFRNPLTGFTLDCYFG